MPLRDACLLVQTEMQSVDLADDGIGLVDDDDNDMGYEGDMWTQHDDNTCVQMSELYHAIRVRLRIT
jgi:hypothetical protein